ncbi:GNAT family N-acetyltransferase [Limoniibacter endophyticus]|uniref:N-acetyltransferase n=1 Tax=Limoniibacter endophyticus TaxID=1565040 RepID=A0A8J3DHV7_9HYPH|nr:GNAT family N-acetyltransferase [Limoniibacter endophyticus]GHC73237.1 N-acetyltransferase [Limoniibacter endophyticus]
MTEQLVLETMGPDHLDGAVALSRQAEWPHRREDWEMVLAVSEGTVALESGRVVATTMMTPYGDNVATINMVIVDQSMRGRGVGRKLMNAALDKAGDRICILVATQDGLPLYEKLGFVATGEILQHQGHAPKVEVPAAVAWATDADFAAIAALDLQASGWRRDRLMGELRKRAQFAVIRDGNQVVAAVGARAFGRGLVIGPVIARDGDEARALIDFMLAKHEGAFVRVDTSASTGLGSWLEERGLKHVGGGIAMRRGEATDGHSPYKIFALVNQALG